MVLLLLVVMLGVQTGSVQAAQPAKGVFETCPACRLNAMPELKRFLMQSIMTKEYGENLSVKYIFGKIPTLILYDAEGKVMSQTEVDARLNFAALHQWVQGMGFVREPAASEGEGNSTTSGTAAADTATQQTPTAAAAGDAAAGAAGNAAGTALLPDTPQTATDGPAVATTAAAAAAAATPAAPAPAEAAPVPAEPPALKSAQAGPKPLQQQQQQQEQQQQRRRHRRRRMRQRGQQGQQQHRRRRQEGPGNFYL